ncbi:MAG TPA: D-alanyl-D-alanine carboxypeptidase family protein [Verrucomicrobiae bacterium]|jgi:D-alanyl-D-alanine carboxypeptidase (penicillin-binding protein 5/6)|nr:D-alanyl-D-alanine carboxypeptidase family protein [Verrucomicrobiae bacterium]
MKHHPLGLSLIIAFAWAVVAVPLLAARAADIQTTAETLYITDYQTGAVLMDKNGEGKIEPASLTKMMTAYLLFEALKSGKLKLTDSFPVSERAWRMQGSKMYVELGNNIKIEDLLRGIVVQSGNDACIVVAEGMAGSEESFAERMNVKAKAFGMTGTHFVNSNGWPDPDHYTTARDLEVLARHLIADYPEYYHYFSELNFTYHGIKQGNRDPLLYKHVGADGIKTGHAEGPGYSLVSSGAQNGRRIIMVVQGLDSKQSRSDEALELYLWAFRNFDNYKLAKAEAPLVAAPVWLGAEETVALGPKTDLVLTLPRDARGQIKATAVFDGPLAAPLAAGQEVGKLHIVAPGMAPVDVPLVTTVAVERLGAFGRMLAAAKYLLRG